MSDRVDLQAPVPAAPAEGRTEGLCLALLLALGLLPRLAFVTLFPIRPVSDFAALVDFALLFRNVSLTASGWHWDLLNPGLPLVLSFLLRIVPGPPEEVARLATAVVCGLVPVLPLLVWRGVLPLGTRLLASVTLALWPGQILFSGVVAQDNWVLPPAVGLACLAVRALVTPGEARPVAAGLTYAAGVAMRQEMLVALLPLVAVAAWSGGREGRWRRLALCTVAACIPLLLLMVQRERATGRFALTSSHAGLATLGAFVPGSTANAWTDPAPYLASRAPELLWHRERMQRAAGRLAVEEALRRPVFHAARISAAVASFLVEGEVANLYWSLLVPDGLPAGRQPLAGAVAARATPLLRIEMAIIQALFVASVLVAIRRRNLAILALGSAILLKIGIHAVTVSQGRYFVVVTAFELLVIALGVREAALARSGRLSAVALSAGALAGLGLFFLAPMAAARVQERDVDGPRTYRFTLTTPKQGGALTCVMDHGRLTGLHRTEASIETFQRDPSPGETATATCDLTGPKAPAPLVIQLYDAYAPGGLPDRMHVRVVIDGREVLRRDLAAEPGVGWMEVPVGTLGPGMKRKVLIEVAAVQPDPGAAWGKAANIRFRLARAEERR